MPWNACMEARCVARAASAPVPLARRRPPASCLVAGLSGPPRRAWGISARVVAGRAAGSRVVCLQPAAARTPPGRMQDAPPALFESAGGASTDGQPRGPRVWCSTEPRGSSAPWNGSPGVPALGRSRRARARSDRARAGPGRHESHLGYTRPMRARRGEVRERAVRHARQRAAPGPRPDAGTGGETPGTAQAVGAHDLRMQHSGFHPAERAETQNRVTDAAGGA